MQTLGLTNTSTALGAELFVVARVVHAVAFTLGVPYLRTVAWFAGVGGILMVGAPFIG